MMKNIFFSIEFQRGNNIIINPLSFMDFLISLDPVFLQYFPLFL